MKSGDILFHLGTSCSVALQGEGKFVWQEVRLLLVGLGKDNFLTRRINSRHFLFSSGGAERSPREKKISRVYSRVREPFLALQDIIFFIF